MFKKTFFQIHWFLGITAGLILALMGVTGAIYSYEQQILKLLNSETYTVEVQNQPKLTPAQIYQNFQNTHPEYKINSITIAADPATSSSINIAKEGAKRGQNIYINPYTAEKLPEIQGQKFFQFIQQLHRNLTIGPVGKQITGACALMLIFFVLSGIYLRWPKKHSTKQWLAVNSKLKGRNFLWNLHAVVGTWVIVFYLILACTGLYWSYDWWRSGMFKVLGVEQPKPELQVKPEAKGETQQGRQTAGEHASSEPKSEKKGLSTQQIDDALTQTWTGFNAKIGREYSTLTLNIPKKANQEVSVSFVDVIPQHERARNQATYNYQTAEIKDLELYEDKKLNEKIMSSMLPVHRGSFFGSIYQFFAMIASLMMPLFFVTGWMLYLKRRKQKKLTAAARQTPSSFEVDENATPWLIVYASQTGVAEQLAWATATSLQEAKQPVSIKTAQKLTPQDLQQHSQVLFVMSTYGTGEAPDLAAPFVKKLLDSKLDLSHINYAVLALGSTEYRDTYCSFGYEVDAWLKANQAQPFFDLITVDNANKQDIERWNTALAQVTQLDLNQVTIDKTFDQWLLSKRTLLNPNSFGQPAYGIELKSQNNLTWQAGDIAEIQPGNSQVRIDAFLTKYQIAANTTISSTGQSMSEALRYKDLTVSIQHSHDLEVLLAQLPDLATREYSIASIPSQQVLRLVVRQHQTQTGELGLGSGWLTEVAPLNSEIPLRIRSNESFHLITDDRPIICIGNGTGIAGLLSLLHTRVRQGHARNWLIFGEREQKSDFFFKETIQAWQTMGMLECLDLAFSRDQTEKVYVHHKLREHATTLQEWIQQGAVIYVCGSINGMASDVDQTLINILGADCVDELRQAGRYKRDVY